MQLIEKVERVIEAATRASKEARIAPLEAAAEKRIASLFRLQGKAFKREVDAARPADGSEPITEAKVDELERRLEKVFIATLKEQWDTFQGIIEDGFAAGIMDAVEQMGHNPDLLWPLLAFDGRMQESNIDRFLMFRLAFNLRSPGARDYIEHRSADLITKVTQTTKDRIRRLLMEGFDEKRSYDQTAKAIIRLFPEMAIGKPQLHIDSRAHLIAVTECFPGDVLVAPFSRPISPLPFPGSGAASLSTGFSSGSESPIRWAARRWYEGDLIEIAMASGNKLTGTPNHPILTDRGWVAIGALAKGDYVICCRLGKRMAISDPCVKDIPAAFSEVFDAIESRPGGAGAKRVATRDMDFHGDGRDGYVDIVGASGDLLPYIQSPIAKPASHEVFAIANLCQSPFTRSAPVGQGTRRFGDTLAHAGNLAHPPLRGRVGIGKMDISLSRRALGPKKPEGFRSIADTNSGAFEDCSDTVVGNAISASNCAQRISGQITCDRIVRVDRKLGWGGHVYNLHTRFGYYTANGVIVQNCGNAYSEGAYQAGDKLNQSGITMEKSWLTSRDDRVSDGCAENEDAGWIGFYDAFPSGHQHPLRHPGCRCSLMQQPVL